MGNHLLTENIAMKYPMIVYKSEGSDYGGLLPDFPGVYPLAGTLDALVAEVQDLIEAAWEGQDPAMFPAPSTLEEVQASHDAQGRVLMLVELDTSFLDDVTERVNITAPRHALHAIDRFAKARGMSRSAYMVEASLAHR